jgi:hypothetical protein
LIEQAVKELVTREKGNVEFLTIFREESLDDYLPQINASRAVLMPGFAIRDTPMHPMTYRLVDDLSQIRVPLIPMGANWNVYPGDVYSRRHTRYSAETVGFLRHVAGQVERFSCREYHVCSVLKNHGITNTVMTGDPAWFDLPSMGKPMRRPAQVSRLVFSPPLSPFYAGQAEQLIEMLAALFPDAEKVCSMHLADLDTADDSGDEPENSAAMTPEVTVKNRRIRAKATEMGFEVRQVSGDLGRIDFYEACDLHVGYECHSHLGFLRKRIPSVMIAEDARGVGFNYTLGVGGFDGFVRSQYPALAASRKTITSGYATTIEEYSNAPARGDVHLDVRQFLEEELGSGFRRYAGMADYLDEVYEKSMRPFVQALP